MSNQETDDHACNSPFNPEQLDDEDDREDWNDLASLEHIKENYIKNIRQNLSNFKSFCPVDAMAKAIGGSFSGEVVKGICQDSERSVKHFERQGKCYVKIEPFLERFKAGLSFEDDPV